MRHLKIDPGLRVMAREFVATLKSAGLSHDDIAALVEEFNLESNGALRRANEQLEQIKQRQARRSLTDIKELKK